jgi:hypothetical protein
MRASTGLPVRPKVAAAHAATLAALTGPGAFWTGAERRALVEATRGAPACGLCLRRRDALAPAAVAGRHDDAGPLPPEVVDAVHRIRTDSGRLTRRWFDGKVAAGIDVPHWVEMVGVIGAATILDTFAHGLGEPPARLPDARPGAPSGVTSDAVVDDGAWVPIEAVAQGPGVGGLPDVPNIRRALARVPEARKLFFGMVAPHYALVEFGIDLDRSQTELIAAKVSALNQCFY